MEAVRPVARYIYTYKYSMYMCVVWYTVEQDEKQTDILEATKSGKNFFLHFKLAIIFFP